MCAARGGYARGHEEHSGMRLRGRAGPPDARMDARQRLPVGEAGEPPEVSALRIAARAVGVQRAADDPTDARVSDRFLGGAYPILRNVLSVWKRGRSSMVERQLPKRPKILTLRIAL